MSEYEPERKGSGDGRKYRDAEVLEELYVNRGLTLEGVGEELDCGPQTVSRWLKKTGIGTRDSGKRPVAELDDEDRLRRLHKQQGLSIVEIAEMFDCGTATVSRWLRKHGIKAMQGVKEELRDESFLREKYIGQGLTTAEIAEEVGCGSTAVADWLHRHGIPVKRGPGSGEDNPMWKEEPLREAPYGRGWDEEKREAVRDRDGRECRGCGTPEDALPKNLDVHHIRPARHCDGDEERNAMENLIALCPSCHTRAERVAPLLPDFV